MERLYALAWLAAWAALGVGAMWLAMRLIDRARRRREARQRAGELPANDNRG